MINRRHLPFLSATALAIGVCFSAIAGLPRVDTHTAPTAAEELAPSVDLYRQHLTTLSNPFFEGRAPGTNGNRLAAEYIEFQLKGLGLQPAFPVEQKEGDKVVASTPRQSYCQIFTAPPSQRPGDSMKITRQEVVLLGADAPVPLKPGVDFNVLGYSGSGEVKGNLVFCGYATRNEDKEYDTFFGEPKLDGKVAVVLRFEPMDAAGKSLWTDGGWSPAAALDSKLRAVERAGAAAIILISPPECSDERSTKLEGLELSPTRGGGAGKIPVIMLSQAAGDSLIRASDQGKRGLMDLRKAADELSKNTSGIIELPGAECSINIKVEKVPLFTDNVGAILPGRGALADEFIVVGSHYDHVGYGYFGSRDADPRGKIHPGADDNGSGTSGNLLVAKWITEAYAKLPADVPARSVLFLWFSAEESGLVGSHYYVNHPIVPIEKHALMLNMDMIGRLREGKLELGGVKTADGFEAWLAPYIESSGLKIKATPSGYGPSDHASFTGVKVPTLFFFTQLHKEYHTPADTIFTINFDGAVKVADLCRRIALDAAMRPEPFKFSTGDTTPDASGEKKDDPNQPAAAGPPVGVRFGIAPGDYTGEEKGVLVGEVFPDLPAAKAGLKEGDLMVKWNDTDLTDVGSWMPMLGKSKPGDVVTIVYRRKVDGQLKDFTTQCTLIARSRARQ